MKVSGPGTSKSTQPIRKAEKKTAAGQTSNSAAFMDALSDAKSEDTIEAVDAVDAVSNVKAALPVDALLSLQEADDPTTGRRKAVRWGHDVLNLLEKLRIDLLLGRVPEARLQNVLNLIRQQQQMNDDPVLKNILDEIEIRAAVEMAKLGRFA